MTKREVLGYFIMLIGAGTTVKFAILEGIRFFDTPFFSTIFFSAIGLGVVLIFTGLGIAVSSENKTGKSV